MKSNRNKSLMLAGSVIAFGSGNIVAQDELPLTVVETANEAAVSHTITELGSEEISRSSLSNIEDLTRYIPGVQVNDSGNRFNDNGFNIRGLQGDDVAVTVDGISLGETLAPASFSAYGMYDSHRGQVEMEHVKSITITKGPSSVANGSNALAGSVAYITNDTSDFLDTTGDDFTARIRSSYDARSDEKMLGLTLANRSGIVESLLQYTYRDGGETVAHGNGLNIAGTERGRADPMSRESTSILAKLSFEFSEGQKLGILYDTKDRESNGLPFSRESGPYFAFRTNDENNKERWGLFYNWTDANIAAFDDLSITLDQQEVYSSGITRFGFSSGGQTYLRTEDRSTFQDSTTLNIDLEKYIDGDMSQEIKYGLEWQSRDIENVRWDRRWNGLTEDSGIRPGYPIRDAAWVPLTETDVFNVFVSDKVQLSNALSMTAGLRYDSTSYNPVVDETFVDTSGVSVMDTEFSTIAGELVFEYEFAPGQSLLASYSQGYKAPSAQQMYLGTDGSEVITDINTLIEYPDLDTVANPNLNAEESASIEFGYKLETDKASLVVTGYMTDYDNRIQNVDLTSTYGTDVTYEQVGFFGTTQITTNLDEYRQPQNVGQVEVQGIEIDATYLWTDNIFTTFTFATIDGEYKTAGSNRNAGDALETAAPDSGTFGIGYQADNDDWGVVLHTLWFDSVGDSTDLSFLSLNNGSGPALSPEGYTVFDLTAHYDVSENLTLTTAIYNLLDEEYYRWEVVNSVRNGNGGFFGGVSGDGIKRYSEPGRSISVNLSYTF